MILNDLLLYIDPGTGSIILQAVVAGIAGVAVAVRLGWRRILRFLGIKTGSAEDSSESSGDDLDNKV